MQAARMSLKILLPYKVFADKPEVVRIVAVTQEGAFGILPNRLDCVAALRPGILVFEVQGEDEVYVAVDEGILVKTGFDVLVSVRNAIGGMELSKLRSAVEEEFMQLDEQEQKVRSVLAKMESGFVRRLVEFQKGRVSS
ncbi:MAG: F0F1 ATP synthase subunit epsilon [Gammaproteobacteria bacterium]